MRLPALLALITALTAVSGYLRESALGATFGAGTYADAYFVAAAVPMVVGDLFIGGALVACIVPVFAPLMAQPTYPRRELNRAASACYWLCGAAASGLCLALLALMPALVSLLSPGFDAGTHRFAVELGRALAWLVLLNGFVLLSSLLLNAAHLYLLPASAWLVINLVFVATVLLGYERLQQDVLVLGPLLGPALMALALFWYLRGKGFAPTLGADFSLPPVRQALRLARPVVITLGIGSGLGILMVSHLLLRAFGSTLGEGGVSALGYAFRLYEVPVSLVTATAGTLVFTEFSRRSLALEAADLAARCRELLTWGALALIPVVCVTALFADNIVRLLFERGAFTRQASEYTADALRGFSPAILFESVLLVGLRILYALRAPGTAVWIGAVAVASLLTAAAISVRAESLALLAAALSASFAVAAVLVVLSVGRLLGRSVWPAAREPVVALALGAAIALSIHHLKQRFGLSSPAADALLICAYGAVYATGVAIVCPRRWAEARALLVATTRGTGRR